MMLSVRAMVVWSADVTSFPASMMPRFSATSVMRLETVRLKFQLLEVEMAHLLRIIFQCFTSHSLPHLIAGSEKLPMPRR
jgi:hypothetical protein